VRLPLILKICTRCDIKNLRKIERREDRNKIERKKDHDKIERRKIAINRNEERSQ